MTRMQCSMMALGATALIACHGAPPALEIPAGEEPLRWAEAITRFEELDRSSPPPEEAALFLGSSSIRLWDSLVADMAPLPVIQRGFGGSRLFDAIYYAERLVAVHEPALVVVFSGTNDIAGPRAKGAAEVRNLFRQLVQRLRWSDSGLPICYIAISPTQARREHLATVLEANRLIRAECEGDPRLEFIDTASSLLDGQGEPDPRWFQEDRLHLNAAGYALWTERIRPTVARMHARATGPAPDPL